MRIIARRSIGLVSPRLLAALAALGISACGDAGLQLPYQYDAGRAPFVDAGIDASLDAGVVGGDDAGSDSDYPAGTLDAHVIVEPGDNGAPLLEAIRGATTSVHVTMYQLTSSTFIDALIAQKAAGREVKVVLNQDFPEGGNVNQTAHDRLSQAGVDVVYASSKFVYTHAKCIIIDGKSAWIMTMNLTPSMTAREFLVTDTDPNDVAEAESIFQADLAKTNAPAPTFLVVAPTNAYARLGSLAAAAKSSLDLEGQTFSDDTIVKALVAAKQRGVTVRVVLSTETPTASGKTAIANLKAAGIPIVRVASPYIHAKAMVVDGTRAYVGSENFTTNSLRNNRELGVILASPPEVAKVASTIAADFTNGTAL